MKQASSRRRHRYASLVIALLLAGSSACELHRRASPDAPPDRPQAGIDAENDAWRQLVSNRLRQAAATYAELARRNQDVARARYKLLEGLCHLLAADFAPAYEAMAVAVESAPTSVLGALAAHQLVETAQFTPSRPELVAGLKRLCQEVGSNNRKGAICLELREAGLLSAETPTETAAWLLREQKPGHPLALLSEPARHQHPKGLTGSWLPATAGTLVLPAAQRPWLVELHSAADIEVDGHDRPTVRLLVVARGDTPWRLVLGGQPLERDAHRRLREFELRAVLQARPGWLPVQLLLPRGSGEVEFTLHLVPLEPGVKITWLPTPQSSRLTLPDKLSQAVSLVPLSTLAEALADGTEAGNHAGPQLLLQALAHWQQGRLDRARLLLQRLLEKYPQAALIEFLLALAIEEDELVPPPVDRGQAQEHLSRALNNCPTAGLARFRLSLLKAGQDHLAAAVQELHLLEHNHPRVFLWPYLLGVVAEQVELPELALQHYRRTRRNWPDQQRVLEREVALLLAQGRLEEARPLADMLWQQGYHQQLVQILKASGQERQLEDALQQALARQPHQPRLLLELARLQIRRHKRPEARDTLLKLLHPALVEGELLRESANLLDRLGWLQEAKTVWSRLWRERPGEAGLWLAGHLHDGTAPLLPGELRSDTQAAIAAYRESGWQPDGELVRVIDHYHYQVNSDGSSLLRLHQLLHLRTAAAAEKWGEVQPPDDGAVVLALRAIKPDGRSFQAQAVSGKDTVSLPGLGEGDFIELDAVLGRAGPALELARPGWLSETRLLSSVDEPVFDWQTSYLLPSGAEPTIDTHGQLPALERLQVNGQPLLRWQQRKISGLAAETLSPREQELSASIVVGVNQDWDSRRRALAAELRFATRPSASLENLAAELCPASASPIDCWHKIFYWTCRNISSGDGSASFEPADHVLARKQGRRLLVLVALLRAAGFAPQVMLARLPQAPHVSDKLPRGDIYTEDVLALEHRGRTYWMVPSGRHQPFAFLEPALYGARALLLWPESAGPFVHLPRPSNPPERRIELWLELSTGGSLRGRGREFIPAAKATAYRDILVGLDEAGRQRLLQAGLSNSFPGAVLEKSNFHDLDSSDRELVIDYHFSVANWTTATAGRWLLPGGFFPYQLGRNLPFELPRRNPILIEDETRTSARISIELPPGWSANELPRVFLRAPLAEFSYRRQQQGRRLLVEKRLVVAPGRISAKQAAEFKAFCLQVDLLDSQPIELRPLTAE